MAPITTIPHLRRVAAGVMTAAAVIGLSSCGGNAGGVIPPNPAPTTATIYAYTAFTALGQWCTADNVVWSATPIAVPAGTGKSTPSSETRNYGRFLPTGGTCSLNYVFPNLQPGKWRLTVVAGSASGACEANFAAGNSRVDFSSGCSVTP